LGDVDVGFTLQAPRLLIPLLFPCGWSGQVYRGCFSMAALPDSGGLSFPPVSQIGPLCALPVLDTGVITLVTWGRWLFLVSVVQC
jgi:hypothetical protein